MDYKPKSYFISNIVLIYDIFLSQESDTLFIIFNSLLHINKFLNSDIKKRTKNQILKLIKELGIKDYKKDFNPIINFKNKNIKIINQKWIFNESNANNNILKLKLNKKIDNLDLSVKINEKHIFKTKVEKMKINDKNIGAVLLFKNENEFLPIWVDYYINKLKVDTIFIYNNNSSNREHYIELQKEYGDKLVFIDWDFEYTFPYGQAQLTCYNHSLKIFGDNLNWMVFTDIDEFIYLENELDLQSFLSNYNKNELSTILFKCLWFGCCNRIDYGPNNFLQKLTKCKKNVISSLEKSKKTIRSGKCIHNPKNVTYIGPHEPIKYKSKFLWENENKIRFNHYFTITKWGKDRSWLCRNGEWKKDPNYKFKNLCNCEELCQIENKQILNKYYKK